MIKKMMVHVLVSIVVIPLLVSCVGTPDLGKTGVYYTKANIWYERPERVYSTNYHVGQIIPAFSEVEILSSGGNKVRFKDKKSGVIITFIHAQKYSIIPFSEFFDRYFSETNNSSDFNNFSEIERKNITNGTIDIGMSKDAVFVAYGNPPSHRTSSLASDRWTYWKNRFNTTAVIFDEGKVSSIVD